MQIHISDFNRKPKLNDRLRFLIRVVQNQLASQEGAKFSCFYECGNLQSFSYIDSCFVSLSTFKMARRNLGKLTTNIVTKTAQAGSVMAKQGMSTFCSEETIEALGFIQQV